MAVTAPFFLALILIIPGAGCRSPKPEITESKNFEITDHVDEDVVYEIGAIQIGHQANLVLTLKNALDEPVIINEVRTFCGCTIPEFETEPILPQKSSAVKITFIADHLGLFSKSVKMYLNTKKKPVQLIFKGEVVM